MMHLHCCTCILSGHKYRAISPSTTKQTEDLDQRRTPNELLHDDDDVPSGNGTSEFNLTFGSDAESGSESELLYYDEEEDLMGKNSVMNLPNHTPLTNGGAEYNFHHSSERIGGCGLPNDTALNGYADGWHNGGGLMREPRTVSLDQLNSAEKDGMVVTSAVVTIG